MGSAGFLRIGSLLSASHNFWKINPNWGRRGPATPWLVICGIWAWREGSLLGLAGLLGGWTGHAEAPSWLWTIRSGWGSWESELKLTWSKCSQEGPAGGAKKRVQRENNGCCSLLHEITTSSNYNVCTSGVQLKMQPGLLWKVIRQRT